MKLSKADREKAISIVESFGRSKKAIINEKGNIVAKPYIIEYVKKRLSENYKPLAAYNIHGFIYTVERINTDLYMTREASGINTKKVLLDPSDILLIKDTRNITRAEMEKLVDKVDLTEMRFGL